MDVDPALPRSRPLTGDQALELLLAALEPVSDAHRPADWEQRRDAVVAQKQRLADQLGAEFDLDEFVRRYDLAGQYDYDFPMGRVDRNLDRLFVPEGMTPAVVRGLADVSDALAWNRLQRYGIRSAARAEVTRDLRLVDASIRTHAVIMSSSEHADDARDQMVRLAPTHVVARRLGRRPNALAGLSDLVPGVEDGPLASFALRTDFDLAAMAWERVATDHGTWFVSTMRRAPIR